MRNKKLTIKIWKEKESNLYVASIDHFNGENYATQGKTMNELYDVVADLLKLLEDKTEE